MCLKDLQKCQREEKRERDTHRIKTFVVYFLTADAQIEFFKPHFREKQRNLMMEGRWTHHAEEASLYIPIA